MEQDQPSVKWFIETQSKWFIQNGIPEWFHGVITRKEAENLLRNKTPGCFLIRVSESRIGYSLSYRTMDRYRHFMIDVLKDQQCIVGGDTRVHLTLADLVKFHTQFPLQPYNEILTLPCGQKTNARTDYEELFQDTKTFTPPFQMPSEASIGAIPDSGVTFQSDCSPFPPFRTPFLMPSEASIGALPGSGVTFQPACPPLPTFTTPYPTPSIGALPGSGVTFQPFCPPVPPRRCQAAETSSKSMSTPCNLPPNQPVNRLYPALPTELQMSNNGDFVFPNRHPANTRSYSVESSIPTAAVNTNCEIKNVEKQGHAPAKPLKACRNAVTKAVSLMTEGEIVQDLKKMENAMATHLRNVKDNFGRFGQTVQKDGSPTLQHKNNQTKVPEEYKPPPPFAPGF